MNVPGRYHVTATASEARASVESDGALLGLRPVNRTDRSDDTAIDRRAHSESVLSTSDPDAPTAEVE